MSRLPAHYRRGVRTALRHNQVAYGYSVTVTSVFGIVAKEQHSPSVADCFLYILGASIAFAVVNVAVTRGFRERYPREPSEVVALATAFSFLSIGGAAGLAALVGWGVGGWPAWLLCPLVASIAFVLLSGAEMGLAGYHHEAGGVDGELDG